MDWYFHRRNARKKRNKKHRPFLGRLKKSLAQALKKTAPLYIFSGPSHMFGSELSREIHFLIVPILTDGQTTFSEVSFTSSKASRQLVKSASHSERSEEMSKTTFFLCCPSQLRTLERKVFPCRVHTSGWNDNKGHLWRRFCQPFN